MQQRDIPRAKLKGQCRWVNVTPKVGASYVRRAGPCRHRGPTSVRFTITRKVAYYMPTRGFFWSGTGIGIAKSRTRPSIADCRNGFTKRYGTSSIDAQARRA